jgi:nucleotidyltransferase/DNA polymerase involved in DNA repair
MSRLVMHVDLDAFYAAIEQRDRPEWRGLPVVVGAEPGKRGVVATCSYEARRYGVHSAIPISEAVRCLPPETVYVRPRMDDYARISRQVMAALKGISPVVEKVSIDEAYLDVSGLELLVGSGWEEETGVQADLFGSEVPALHPRDECLDEALDAIRRKFGKGYLQRGLTRRR